MQPMMRWSLIRWCDALVADHHADGILGSLTSAAVITSEAASLATIVRFRAVLSHFGVFGVG